MLDTVNIPNFYLSVIKKNVMCFSKAQPDLDSETGSYYPNPQCLKEGKGSYQNMVFGTNTEVQRRLQGTLS